MVKFSGSELVVMKKTRSSARIPVADEHTAYPDVDAFTVVAGILQYPPTMPAKFVPLPPTTNRVVLAYSYVTRVVEAFPNVERPVTFSVPAVAKLPLAAVVVAKPFTMKLPVAESRVVEAFPNVERPVTFSVPAVAKLPLAAVVVAKPFTMKLPVADSRVVEAFPNVERPVTFNVPAVAKLPLAAVVVAYPFTIKFPVVERIVVVAFPRAVSPVTDSVPSTEILVPMLVAYTNPETKRTEHNTDKTTERTL